MKFSLCAATALMGVLVAAPVQAQSNPVADAFRNDGGRAGKNLVAALETVPADKYGFKPTPAQMSVADIADHLAEGNDFLCSRISGMDAPKRDKLAEGAGKDALVARVKETFDFCNQALARLDDSKLTEELPMWGGRKMTRAAVMTLTTADWADHYSQLAIYLRLNGLLPPTARQQGAGE